MVVLYHPDYDYFYCYRYYLDPGLGAIEMKCDGEEGCAGGVEAINKRWNSLGSKGNVWLLKQRARGDWPEGLERGWEVEERIEFNNGEMEKLRRKDGGS